MTPPPLEPLNGTYFTAIPRAEIASTLGTRYRTRLKRSILSYLTSVQRALKVDLTYAQEKHLALDPTRRFSPSLYMAHALLRDAIRKGDVTHTVDGVQRLLNLSEPDIYDAVFRVSSILTEPWESPFIDELREQPVHVTERPAILRPLLRSDLSFTCKEVNTALELLVSVDTGIAAELNEYVTRLKLFLGRTTMGATAPRVFGAVYLRVPNAQEPMARVVYFVEHLVHEVSHLHLNAMMAEDPLVINPWVELFEAPIRRDLRPMFGVYHATFVLGRILRVFKKWSERQEHPIISETLLRTRNSFSKGLDTVIPHANVTNLGRQVIDTLWTCSGETIH